MSCELRDVQAGFRKGRGTRDQIANICWIIEQAREFQKNIYFFASFSYSKAFDCVDHNKMWKILQDMEIPDHLTSLLQNLYAGQEAIVRTRHGTIDWVQLGKGVCQGRILPALLIYLICRVQFSSVQSLGHVWLFVTPSTAACQASLSITNSQSLLKLMSRVRVSDAIQPSHYLSSSFPPTFNLSQHQGLFKWVSFSHQVPKI